MVKKRDQNKAGKSAVEEEGTGLGPEEKDDGAMAVKGSDKGKGKSKKRSKKHDLLSQAIEDDESNDLHAPDDSSHPQGSKEEKHKGKKKDKLRGAKSKKDEEKHDDDEKEIVDGVDDVSEKVENLQFNYGSASEEEKDASESKEKGVKSKKMTRKEKKEALKKAKFEAEVEQLSAESQFAVSQQEQSTKGAILENATDIKGGRNKFDLVDDI
eukprot:gene16199-17829_t